MSGPPVPLTYLPLAWTGVIGTSLTYAALTRARVDVAGLLTSLKIRNQFTLAVCLYNIWTIAAAFLLYHFLGRQGITGAAIGLVGNLSLAGATLALAGAVLGIAVWPMLDRIMGCFGSGRFRLRLPESRQANKPSVLELVLLAICNVVTAPALEEYIFRGYVLTALQQYTMSVPIAIIATSLAFASIHVAFGSGVVVYAFVLSLILSGLALSSSNLYPAILMHALVNLWGFVVAPILPRPESRDSSPAS